MLNTFEKIILVGFVIIVSFSFIELFSQTNDIIIKNPKVKDIKLERLGNRIITAYTIGNPDETDNTPCIGAYNDNLCELAQTIRICASNEFEKGTILHIDGLFDCVVMDKMNSRFLKRIDIGFTDRSEAIKFGKQDLLVYKK